ncbi:MAG: hypothetical protein K9K66_16810 [Desulfarculaceae bacterium]|nr:hypothetical protein [Desulfarculaceae bacterium]MCF8072608.1 hypothetical protein [Desulfarculaceae bacterium]MCF8103320.1 hypothetical protein [Desulfarculaceae bacterium]MCF8117802.1 hypothetical protein [Desulfarculaceae bacterium]
MAAEQTVINFIFKVVIYGGGSAAFAYGIFSFLGKKWIENKFRERLDKLKYEQEKELEDLKLTINTLFNRITKIHEIEIGVLPELWCKLVKAINHATSFVDFIEMTPDINKIKEKRRLEIFDQYSLSAGEQEEVLDSDDMNRTLYDIIFWKKSKTTWEVYEEFSNCYNKNLIFLSPELKEGFDKFQKIMKEAILNRQLAKKYDQHDRWKEAYDAMKDENISSTFNKIESLIQKRLHFERA